MTGILRKYKEEYRKLLQLGGPILVTQLSVIVFAFSDTIMVGHYSVNALAAAAFVNSLFLVPNVMMMGLASGVTPLVGALYSQRKCREAGSITRSSLQVNIVMALICTLIMGLMYFMLPYMGQAPELLPQIRSYYLVLMLMPVPMAVYNVLAQSSNGIEYTSVPMWVTVGGILLNIFGNWVLIYGKLGFPEMGLLGAGIATVFGRVVAMVAMLAAFRKLHRYRDYQGGFTARCRRGAERVKAWKTSWPLMLQSGAECVLWTVGAVVVGWFGPVQLAAYQVVNTISQLGFMVFMSFASAVAIRVAYYAGLRNEQGAGAVARAGLHVNLVLATIVHTLCRTADQHLHQHLGRRSQGSGSDSQRHGADTAIGGVSILRRLAADVLQRHPRHRPGEIPVVDFRHVLHCRRHSVADALCHRLRRRQPRRLLELQRRPALRQHDVPPLLPPNPPLKTTSGP